METVNDFNKMPPNKIILGVLSYGYNWFVEDDSEYSKRTEWLMKVLLGPNHTSKGKGKTPGNKPHIKWNERKITLFTQQGTINHLRTVL